MQVRLADLADHYSILILKQEAGLPKVEDPTKYEDDLRDVDCSELYHINQMMWDLEDLVTDETDLAKIGAYYLALRSLTVKRVAAKNKIARSCGQPEEVKNYA